MDTPDPIAEYLNATSKTEWTLVVYDSFNGEQAVVSRHKTEAEANAAKGEHAKAHPEDELLIHAPG